MTMHTKVSSQGLIHNVNHKSDLTGQTVITLCKLSREANMTTSQLNSTTEAQNNQCYTDAGYNV